MLNTCKKKYRFRVIAPAYPAFNVYSSVASITTALGPVYIATAVNKLDHWEAEMIDENNLCFRGPRGRQKGADHVFLQEERPADVVGFYGGLTSTVPRLYDLARFYKSQGAVTVAGGQHFIDENIDEALSSGIDYVVIGEGEETIKELVKALTEGTNTEEIKGIAFLKEGKAFFTRPRPQISDFENLPFPDFSLVRYARLKLYPVEQIRGCGMDCEFCTVKGKPRSAGPERLLEQVKRLVETRNARHFFIVDDLFGQYRDEAIKFCYQLRDYQRRIRIRSDLTAQIRLDRAKDKEFLLAMRQAGINTVAIGFESPIAEELKAMNKHIRPEEMLSLIKIFHKFGFLVHGMFIFAYPMEAGVEFKMTARERMNRYQQFIRRAKLDTIQVLTPIALPGTRLRARLIAQNRVYPLQQIGWEYYDGNFPVMEPDAPLTPEEMQTSARKIMSSFYRFGYFFKIGFNILLFPGLVFFLGDLRSGWRKWYHHWRNDLIRFMGWMILQKWELDFKKSEFLRKIHLEREKRFS
jgi:radical SAM superfamily enzyme YgiQ (UPF0313 family)